MHRIGQNWTKITTLASKDRPPWLLHTSASSSLIVWFFYFISFSSFLKYFAQISLFHIAYSNTSNGYTSLFWVFPLPFETDQNQNTTETDWFPIISVDFGWEFYKPKFSVSVGETQRKLTKQNQLHP